MSLIIIPLQMYQLDKRRKSVVVHMCVRMTNYSLAHSGKSRHISVDNRPSPLRICPRSIRSLLYRGQGPPTTPPANPMNIPIHRAVGAPSMPPQAKWTFADDDNQQVKQRSCTMAIFAHTRRTGVCAGMHWYTARIVHNCFA